MLAAMCSTESVLVRVSETEDFPMIRAQTRPRSIRFANAPATDATVDVFPMDSSPENLCRDGALYDRMGEGNYRENP